MKMPDIHLTVIDHDMLSVNLPYRLLSSAIGNSRREQIVLRCIVAEFQQNPTALKSVTLARSYTSQATSMPAQEFFAHDVECHKPAQMAHQIDRASL